MLIQKGSEVAVLPEAGSPANAVLEILKVAYAGPVYTQLEDGRKFASLGGKGINHPHYIVLATDEHRAALGAGVSEREHAE